MAYRSDPDLDFLRDVPSSSSGLDLLVETLITDKDGDPRLTEELTMNDRYKEFSPDHHAYWDLIAAEIQCFGANTLATLFRGGEGVLYKEVLTDVCDKIKVNYNKNAKVETIELGLMMKVLADATQEMSSAELKAVCDELGISPTRYTSEAFTIALQVAIKRGGFLSYQIAVIVANAVLKATIGRGLSVALNATLTRSMSIFAGPIGWVLSGLWLLVDIAGPAYRITIPAAIVVAYLRLENLQRVMQEEGTKEK